MRTKQIIITIIMIAALAGAGVFGYLSLSRDSSTAAPPESATANSILPKGTTLNFDKVNRFNETGRQFQYPSVTPADAGLTLNEIMQQ